MGVNTVDTCTPYYVLMDGNSRIGPTVVRLPSGIECAPIYGFSDKNYYLKFCGNSQLALTPYPLVKSYLRNQIETPSGGLKLVVVDAADPLELCIHAVTMKAALECQENRTAGTTATHRLTFDHDAEAYQVEEVST